MGAGDGMGATSWVGASDLFVMLEKEYRKRTRGCAACEFTLPHQIRRGEGDAGGWFVIPNGGCTPECRSALEDLVALFQKTYRLA